MRGRTCSLRCGGCGMSARSGPRARRGLPGAPAPGPLRGLPPGAEGHRRRGILCHLLLFHLRAWSWTEVCGGSPVAHTLLSARLGTWEGARLAFSRGEPGSTGVTLLRAPPGASSPTALIPADDGTSRPRGCSWRFQARPGPRAGAWSFVVLGFLDWLLAEALEADTPEWSPGWAWKDGAWGPRKRTALIKRLLCQAPSEARAVVWLREVVVCGAAACAGVETLLSGSCVAS